MTKISLNEKFLEIKRNEEIFKEFLATGDRIIQTPIHGEELNMFEEFDNLFKNIDDPINLLKAKIFFLNNIIRFYHWLEITALQPDLIRNLMENKEKYFNCDEYFLDTVLEFHEIYKEELLKFYNRNLLIYVGECKFFNSFEEMMDAHVDVNNFDDYIGVIEIEYELENIFVMEDGSIKISNIDSYHNPNHEDERRMTINHKNFYHTPINNFSLLTYGFYRNCDLITIYHKLRNINIDGHLFLKDMIIKRPSDNNYPYLTRFITEAMNLKENKYNELFNEIFNVKLTLNDYMNDNYGGDQIKKYELGNSYIQLYLSGVIAPYKSNAYVDCYSNIFRLFELEYFVYILNKIITPFNRGRIEIVFNNFESLFLENALLNKNNKTSSGEVRDYLQKIYNFIDYGDASMPIEWQLELL